MILKMMTHAIISDIHQCSKSINVFYSPLDLTRFEVDKFHLLKFHFAVLRCPTTAKIHDCNCITNSHNSVKAVLKRHFHKYMIIGTFEINHLHHFSNCTSINAI